MLIDTGPIVGLIAEADQYREAALEGFAKLNGPMITCWPVITEAAWLMRNMPSYSRLLARFLNDQKLQIEHLTKRDLPAIEQLLTRYQDLKLQLADACLLQLADRLNLQHIFTFDQRDFNAATTPSGRTLQQLGAAQ